MSQSLRSRTVSGMVWVGIQRFGSVLIAFLSNIVLARMLTPDDYGYVGMLLIFIAVASTFIDGGLGSALIQKTKPTEKDYSTVFYWNLALSLVLYGVLFACAPLIARFYQMPLLCSILRLQGVVLIINATTIVQFNKLRKQMQFKKIAVIQIVSALISVTVAIGYAWKGGGVWALVWQQIVNSLVNVLLLFFVVPWKPEMSFSKESFRSLFGFGSFILLSNLINTFANNLNGLIVGKFFSASTLGYLTQAQKLENVASLSIAAAVEQVTYPLLVEVKNDYSRMSQILRVFNNALLSVVMPAMYLIMILAKSLIVFLFTDKWLLSAPILQILCFQGIFICLGVTSYNVIVAIGESKALFNWTLIKRLSGIIMLIGGMLCWGFKGVLVGMIMTYMIIWLCNSWLAGKFIGYKLGRQIIDIVPVGLIATIPFACCWVAKSYDILGNKEYVYAMLYVFVYIVAIMIVPHRIIKELRSNLKNIISKRR